MPKIIGKTTLDSGCIFPSNLGQFDSSRSQAALQQIASVNTTL